MPSSLPLQSSSTPSVMTSLDPLVQSAPHFLPSYDSSSLDVVSQQQSSLAAAAAHAAAVTAAGSGHHMMILVHLVNLNRIFFLIS